MLNRICSRRTTVSAGVPQGSDLDSLFFLVYVNDISDNVHCDITLFADYGSIFSIGRKDRSSEELNRDLEQLHLWLWQWKVQFNVDKLQKLISLSKGCTIA